MANLSITVCDTCQDLQREAESWAIHGPDGSRKMDLCRTHAAELEELLDRLSPGSRPTARRVRRKTTSTRRTGPRTGDDFDARVKTMEEIEKLKTT